MSSTNKVRPGPKDKISDQRSRDAIKRRYQSSEPLVDIAADYKLSLATVRKIAVDEGASPRSVGRPKGKKAR